MRYGFLNALNARGSSAYVFRAKQQQHFDPVNINVHITKILYTAL